MTRAPATATLIVSPLASRIRDTGTRERVLGAAAAAIRARGHAGIEVVETGDPATISDAAAAAVSAGHGLVVLAGGDGTVRDASRSLAGTGIEVGIVPCGTGNLYASAVGVPRMLDAAADAIAHAPARPFDVGAVRLVTPVGTAAVGEATAAAGTAPAPLPADPIDFVVACGTGFDAAMIASTDREMKRRYGVAAYFIAASRLLPTMAPRPTTLVVDGERTELESVVVLVANCGEAIPGVLRPRLPIEPDDGVLHVFVLPRGGVVGGIRGVLELMSAATHGISPSGHAVRLVGREVRVEVEPAGPTQIDGDAFPSAWLDARIQPGGLRIIRAAPA